MQFTETELADIRDRVVAGVQMLIEASDHAPGWPELRARVRTHEVAYPTVFVTVQPVASSAHVPTLLRLDQLPHTFAQLGFRARGVRVQSSTGALSIELHETNYLVHLVLSPGSGEVTNAPAGEPIEVCRAARQKLLPDAHHGRHPRTVRTALACVGMLAPDCDTWSPEERQRAYRWAYMTLYNSVFDEPN